MVHLRASWPLSLPAAPTAGNPTRLPHPETVLQARYDKIVVEYDKTEAQLMAARNQVVMLQTQLGELQAKKPTEPVSVQGVKQPTEPATIPSAKRPSEPASTQSGKKPTEPASIQGAKTSSTAASGTHAGP